MKTQIASIELYALVSEFQVLVNGKVRDKMSVQIDMDQAGVEELIRKSDKVNKYLAGQEIKKIIYIPNKLINIVV